MKKKSFPGNAILLPPAEKKCFTKFGGKPHLPEKISWPVNQQGYELNFLAQIHFPELAAKTKLPAEGTVFIFYDDSSSWKIIYSEDPLPESQREPAPMDILPRIYRETFRTFKVLRSPYSHSAPRHQMLGHPFCIQNDDPVPGHTLLLQLDSDWERNGPGWIWGDAGLLYFFILPEDLKNKRFEKVKCVWQCC